MESLEGLAQQLANAQRLAEEQQRGHNDLAQAQVHALQDLTAAIAQLTVAVQNLKL